MSDTQTVEVETGAVTEGHLDGSLTLLRGPAGDGASHGIARLAFHPHETHAQEHERLVATGQKMSLGVGGKYQCLEFEVE